MLPVLVYGDFNCPYSYLARAQALHLSSAVEVRRVITTVMWPPEDMTARLASPEFPSLLRRDPDLTQIVRRSGGTIVFGGGPLTSAGWRRIRQWRHEWLTLPSQTVPAVIGHDEILRPGIDGLRYLADLVHGVTVRPGVATVAAITGAGTISTRETGVNSRTMDTEHLLAPEDSSPLGRSRAEVLDVLRVSDGPLGVREVAERTGLHPNTARFHLEALVEAGLAVRGAQDRATPGRPRIDYRAVADGLAGRRRYRLLAEMLTTLIAGTMPAPGRAAEEAGRQWGAYLTEQPTPYQKPSADEAIGKLAAIMAELGFAPQAEAGSGGQYRIRLRQCPFREVAQHHQDVICSLHLGLMRGALAQMRAPVTADRLDPFVEPSLCVALLSDRGNQAEPQQPVGAR